jgi:hypothetical protein
LKNIRLYIFVFLIILTDCTSQDGVLQSSGPEFGSLAIISNTDSAHIFIDQNPTGRFTQSVAPVIFDSLTTGAHTVQLQQECYKADDNNVTVLIEANKKSTIQLNMQLLESAANLYINTTPDSAVVVFDGLVYGRSPVSLNCLPTGQHTLQLLKSNYTVEEINLNLKGGKSDTLSTELSLKRTVLMEHFSSSSCVPCVPADVIIEKLLIDAGPLNVVSINYHTEIPFPGDPMYLTAKQANDARIAYYKIFSNPIAFLDGLISESGTSDLKSRLTTGMAARAQVTPAATIEVLNYKNGPLLVAGELEIIALQGLTANLFIALVENTIEYDLPPGHNGQKHFFDVFREFYPSPTGDFTMVSGEKTNVPFNFNVNDQWNYSQLKVVAFLQTSEKEILQAASSAFP